MPSVYYDTQDDVVRAQVFVDADKLEKAPTDRLKNILMVAVAELRLTTSTWVPEISVDKNDIEVEFSGIAADHLMSDAILNSKRTGSEKQRAKAIEHYKFFAEYKAGQITIK